MAIDKCPACGAEVPETVGECQRCGLNLGASGVPAGMIPEGTTDPRARSTETGGVSVKYLKSSAKGSVGLVGRGALSLAPDELVFDGKKQWSFVTQLAVFVGINLVACGIAMAVSMIVMPGGLLLALIIDVMGRTATSVRVPVADVQSVTCDEQRRRFLVTAFRKTDLTHLSVAWVVEDAALASSLKAELTGRFSALFALAPVKGSSTF